MKLCNLIINFCVLKKKKIVVMAFKRKKKGAFQKKKRKKKGGWRGSKSRLRLKLRISPPNHPEMECTTFCLTLYFQKPSPSSHLTSSISSPQSTSHFSALARPWLNSLTGRNSVWRPMINLSESSVLEPPIQSSMSSDSSPSQSDPISTRSPILPRSR